MALTGDHDQRHSRANPAAAAPRRLLAGWLTSAASYTVWSDSRRGQPVPKFDSKPTAPFSLAAAVPSASATTSTVHGDVLLTLDIDHALFPSSLAAARDPFSPSAFRNLEMNATGVLRRFQAAYFQLAGDASSLREQLAEARARHRHLKLQVKEMEIAMRQLMHELASEKSMRTAWNDAPRTASVFGADALPLSEHLDAETDQRESRSRSTTIASDDSGDSLEYSCVFSSPRSVVLSISDLGDGSLVGSPSKAPRARAMSCALTDDRSHRTAPSVPKLTATATTPHILVSSQFYSNEFSLPPVSQESDPCQKCLGRRVSVTWDTARVLWSQNRALKLRVAELECSIEDALAVISDVGA